MRNSVIAGLVLGVLVALVTLVFGYSGLYKTMAGAIAFIPVAILLNIGVVVWGLTKTRAEGRGYGGQIVAALVMAVVASVIIFANSMLFTTTLFPNYIQELADLQTEMLQAAGTPQADIDLARQAALAKTSVSYAMQGVIGTILTTLVVALIAAAFIRKKD